MPAPALAGAAKQLEAGLTRDSLSRQLAHRKQSSDLVSKGILEGTLYIISYINI
jgi:hypothetical protein